MINQETYLIKTNISMILKFLDGFRTTSGLLAHRKARERGEALSWGHVPPIMVAWGPPWMGYVQQHAETRVVWNARDGIMMMMAMMMRN